MRTAYAALAVCLFAFAAMGGTITSLDPPSIVMRSGEYFMTFNGTDLRGLVTYDGPAGTFELETNADFPGSVVAWVPMDIVNTPGTYKVMVGDSNTLSFNVTKPGRPLLSLHLPEILTAITKTRIGVPIHYEVNVTDAEGEVTIECDPKPGSTFPLGESTIRCIASDQGGNRADGVISVKVWDGVAPILEIPKGYELPSEDERGTTLKYETRAFDEVDGDLPVTCLPESGSFFPNGRTRVNCETTDLSLNPAYGSFDVFVQPKDPGRLELKLPDKVVEVAQNETGAEVFYEVIAYGTADPDPVVVCSPSSGTFFPMKETKVYCTGEDDFGSRAEGAFYVEVIERLGLKLPDVTAEATSPSGTEVTFEAVAEEWTNELRCSPSSGSLFALGETTVECESTDDRGRSAAGTFLVNVADTIAPHIGRVQATAGAATRDSVVPVQVDVDVTDSADAAPRCSITTLTADDSTGFDWRLKGDLEVDVRAAESRAFRIQVTCVDASGNRSTGSASVTAGGNRPRLQQVN